MDMVNVLLVGVELGHFKVILRAELVGLITEDVVVEVVIKQSDNEPSVLIVSDSASVVALSSEILQGGEGYFVILVDEHLELPHRDTQVGLIELVRDIPSKGTVFSAFLDDCVEEGKCKDKNFVIFRLVFVSLEELLAGDRVSQVGSSQVGLKALRRLICHFHTILQNRSREFLGRV